MKNKRHARVGVEKGFGPRHMMNAQEGSEAVPSELPSPPGGMGENYGGKALRMLLDQVVDPETRAEIARNPTGAKALSTYASLGIMLMPGHEGMPMGEKAGVPKMAQPGLKVPDMAPRYEGPPEAVKESGKKPTWEDWAVKGPEQFPSLDKPPYDALKAPQDFSHEELLAMDKAQQEGPSPSALAKWDAIKQKYGIGKNVPPEEPPPEEEAPFEPNVPRYARGKRTVQVHRGYGPRHAENAKEGDLTQVNTDTVPAMLTPREAVLNRNAAEIAGRGNIEKLNAEGNVLAQKGVDLAARGQTSVMPALLPKAPRRVATSNVLKYVPEGQIRREVAAAIPKGVQKGTSDMKPKKMQGGGNVAGTDPNPYNSNGVLGQPGSGTLGQPGAGVLGQPGGTLGQPGVGVLGQPGGGTLGMPGMQSPGSAHEYYASHPNFRPNFWRNPTTGDWQRRSPGGGGGFYPPGQGIGLASGTPEVPDTIGSPNTQTAYGPPITLTAPQLQHAAQQAGLSQGQLMGLMKAVQGVGSLAGGGGAAPTDVSSGYYGLSQSPGGYQGGISDIGYPPTIGQGMDYHGDRGGWLGQFDPNYTFSRYARGTSMVPGW